MKISMIQFSSVKFQIEKNYEKVLNFMQDAISKKNGYYRFTGTF